MKQQLIGYPEALATKVSLYLAQIYGHSQGHSAAEFKRLCFNELKHLIAFDSGCWLTYEDSRLSCPTDDSWTYCLPTNSAKQQKAIFEKPLSTLRFNAGIAEFNRSISYPDSSEAQKKFYRTEHYRALCKPLNVALNLTTVKKSQDDDGIDSPHQLISLFRANSKALFSQQDIDIKTFITPHLIEAYKLNQLSSAQRDWKSGESYRAICDKQGNIREAEAGFYNLLALQLTNGTKHTLPIATQLKDCQLSAQLKLGDIKIDVTIVDDICYLEATKEDTRLNKLTKTECRVAALLSEGLRTKVIAEQLGSSPRTVEKHLASLYKKLGTANKNNTVGYLVRNKDFFDRD